MVASYSSDLSIDALDFTIAATSARLKIKYIESSYEETIEPEIDDETEEDIAVGVIKPILPEVIEHVRHYLIISGEHSRYGTILKYIDALSNQILSVVLEECYKYCSSTWFVKYDIDETLFKYKRMLPDYKDKRQDDIDNIDFIISRLPNGYSLYDLFDIITIRTNRDNCCSLRYYASVMDEYELSNFVEYLRKTSKTLSKYKILEIERCFTEPKYEIGELELDDAISDEELDQRFLVDNDAYNLDDENYERIELGTDHRYTDEQVREYYNAHNEERLSKFKREVEA